MEQDTGVEPAFTAWEAVVLPIYESCEREYYSRCEWKIQHFFVAGFVRLASFFDQMGKVQLF